MNKRYELKLAKKAGRVINQYNLIKADDTVAIALSGGKDSYTLLELLNLRLSYLPIHYKLIGVHVDFGFNPEEVSNIRSFCDVRSIPCIIEKRILEPPRKNETECFWCSWNRRKALFEVIERENISTLAFGHTMDDVVETLLLNMCYEARFESMLPKTIFFGGKLAVIRPLFFMRNAEILEYSKFKQFPIMQHKCPFSVKTERTRMRKILSDLSVNYKNSLSNMMHSWIKKMGSVQKDMKKHERV